jgi:hypothetical protein
MQPVRRCLTPSLGRSPIALSIRTGSRPLVRLCMRRHHEACRRWAASTGLCAACVQGRPSLSLMHVATATAAALRWRVCCCMCRCRLLATSRAAM